MPIPVNIYCCYHSNDKKSWEDLESHLAILKRNGQVVTFDWLNISPGSNQEYEREAHLATANIILLIISKNFISDDSCWNTMEQAMKRYQDGKLKVIPIRYRPVYYDSAPFTKLSILPKGNPVSCWSEPDEAYENIVEEIIKLVDSLYKENNVKDDVQRFTPEFYESRKQVPVEPLDLTRLLHAHQEDFKQ